MPRNARIPLLALAAFVSVSLAVVAPAAAGEVIYAALEPLRAPADASSSAPRAFSAEVRRRRDLMFAIIRLLSDAAASPDAEQWPARPIPTKDMT